MFYYKKGLKMNWINVRDKFPKLSKMVTEPMTEQGQSIPTMYVSVEVLLFKNGKVSVGAVEWFNNGWINATHWMPLPDAPKET